MNLLDLAVKITCDDQASDNVSEISDGIKNKLSAAAKIGAAAVVAVGAAAAATTKKALDSYSAYEQAVGGVQKLYGNMGQSLEKYAASVGQTTDQARAKWQALGKAQTTMLKQAQGAFATCGMSANTYMEQATSFSAALINSLGGDTVKAAAQTQKAMVAMADNVNTFGTAMEDVQNAYQGFAKQNYTMLDNLKLGYGGTQSEMQRLIDDANEYGKSIGMAGDLSIDSFSDIVDAIDLVQQKQQIAGTTSREAATTIEGSVTMMKAAWENWLTSLGAEDWDVSETTEALVKSIEAAASNIVPRVSEIVTTAIEELPKLIGTLAPELAAFLKELFSTALDTLWKSLPGDIQVMLASAFLALDESGLSATVKGILERMFGGAKLDLSGLMDGLTDAFQSDAFVSTLGALSSALQVVQSFFDGIAETAQSNLVPALQPLVDAWKQLMDAIQQAQPWLDVVAAGLGETFVIAVTGAVEILTTFVAGIAEIIQGFTDFVNWLAQAAQGAADFATGVGQTLSALPGQVAAWLNGVIQSVVAWVTNMAANAEVAGRQFVANVRNFFVQLPGNVASWLSGVISTVVGWVSQFASNAVSAASQFGSKLRDGLAAIPGTLGNIGANIIQGLVNGVTGAAGKLIDSVKGAVGDAIQGAKNLLGIKSPSRVFRKIGQYAVRGAALGVDDDADLL